MFTYRQTDRQTPGRYIDPTGRQAYGWIDV